MEKISIILVDDHTMVRAGMRELLKTFPDVTVVAQGDDGYQAIELADQYKPDVLILDISMPKLRGIEAIKDIKKRSPETKIIILSMYERDEYIKQSLRNGASGYLLKQSATDELKSAIHTVMRDQIFLSPYIAKSVVESWLTANQKPDTGDDEILSDRELEVLKLLTEGHSNKETAELLHLSVKTVETHRYKIMEKLNLDNFAGMVKYAIKKHYIDLD